MHVAPTTLLHLHDDQCFETDARVLALHEQALACDRSCFYPGGGGQPPDLGSAHLADGTRLEIVAVEADAAGVLWHRCASEPPAALPGASLRLVLDRARRLALARYHTVLHVLNTIVLREHGGWMTGAQIAVDYARIDFRIGGFSAALRAALEEKVNAVISADRPLRAYRVPETEYRLREDLRRTLAAPPPVSGGGVRVVEIEGFDAQACGGTHVRRTGELGRFSIPRSENKGRNNKRLYVHLVAPPGAA